MTFSLTSLSVDPTTFVLIPVVVKGDFLMGHTGVQEPLIAFKPLVKYLFVKKMYKLIHNS
jgi:hypothetical protein